jgi:HKD family nuclease
MIPYPFENVLKAMQPLPGKMSTSTYMKISYVTFFGEIYNFLEVHLLTFPFSVNPSQSPRLTRLKNLCRKK